MTLIKRLQISRTINDNYFMFARFASAVMNTVVHNKLKRY